MKNLIILLFAIIALSSCNNSKKQTTEANSFKSISWKTERFAQYQLIRPIDFKEGGTDVYGIKLNPNNWYLIREETECYPSPVTISSTFMEDILRLNKIAMLDTISANLLNSQARGAFRGLIPINKLEIVCFIEMFEVCPVLLPSGEITVGIRKRGCHNPIILANDTTSIKGIYPEM